MADPTNGTPEVSREIQRDIILGTVFTPAAPINRLDLFAGRGVQRSEIIDAILQRGRHAVLFGERGVGKTSLASTLQDYLQSVGKTVVAARENCVSADDFTSVWRKVFTSLRYEEEKPAIGLTTQPETVVHTAAERFQGQKKLSPDDVKRVLGTIGEHNLLIVIIDEFDLISEREGSLFADTIKTLSDHSIPATVILVGVADTVTTLIQKHESVQRAIAQVRLTRMSEDELGEIIDKGLTQAGMQINQQARKRIVSLSQGLPHYTHLVTLYAARRATHGHRLQIEINDVKQGIADAVRQAQETIVTKHHKALMSPRVSNILREVALACAVASTDDRGFFRPSSIREPLRIITGKTKLDVPRYMHHLTEFCEDKRGPLLRRIGTSRNYRFRFADPLLQPFVIMDGMAKGLLDEQKLTLLKMTL